MSSGNRPDDLLKDVLKDDLPPQVERNMKERFLQFRQRQLRARRDPRPAGRRWGIREEALAFASLILVIAGGLLHVSGDRGAVAETLSFLNASISISDALLSVRSMECNLDVASGDGIGLHYTIRWLPPDLTRVDLHGAGGRHDTFWSSGSHRGSREDPLMVPIREFLSPEALADTLYRAWKPGRRRQDGGVETETLVYANGPERRLIEMTADRNTRLPVSIRTLAADDVVLEARFIWNEPISTEVVTPNR